LNALGFQLIELDLLESISILWMNVTFSWLNQIYLNHLALL